MIRAGIPHVAVFAEIHGVAFPPGQRWGPDAVALQLGQPGSYGFIHPCGGIVLARAVAGEAEILTLAVRPEVRRQGIARALLGAAMREAASCGAGVMFLEVAAGNRPARALYAALGFAEIGRRRRYYAGGADALVLRAALTPPGSAPGR